MRNKHCIKRKFNILENNYYENNEYNYINNLIIPNEVVNCVNYFIKLKKCANCNDILCKCCGYFERLINFHKDLTQYAIIHNIHMIDNDIYSNANLKQIAYIILDNNGILSYK
jgi:hypothetical protein